MLTSADLPTLTDPRTIDRGRAYQQAGKVLLLGVRVPSTTAMVDGTDPYAVDITSGRWSCSCPVGGSGAFCKHCVAVVLATEQPAAARPVVGASGRRPVDVDALRREVETLSTRRALTYWSTMDYARDAAEVVDLLEDPTARPSAELLTVVERAMALTVRAILRADDSAGTLGDQICRLLDLHAFVASRLTDQLDRKARLRLASWMYRFRFDGTQDFFEVDVNDYAAVLGSDGVERYRALVDGAERDGLSRFGVANARGRLAILDRDPAAIVAAHGRDLSTQYDVASVVAALDIAGFAQLATEHARRGLDLPPGPRRAALVDRLVLDARERGDTAEAVDLRWGQLGAAPSTGTFVALRVEARAGGTWDDLRPLAEAVLAERRPGEFVSLLLSEDRDDEAWDAAGAQSDGAVSPAVWDRLCSRRARTAPADVLPIYRRLVELALQESGRASAAEATRLLTAMRDAATSAGRVAEFRELVDATAEAYRRRPTWAGWH